MQLKDRIKEKIIILDGATGTELHKKGMPAGVCPEIWCLEKSRHNQWCACRLSGCGRGYCYTATFGANGIKLSQYGAYDVVEINRDLTLLARRAVGADVLLAGDICSTGRFVRPFGDLDFEEAIDAYKEQVKGLLEGGVDLFVIETMMDIQETRAALIAVKELSDKFAIVTMTYEKTAGR